MKRFEDSEARIIGFEEQCTNTNEAEEDELGHTKRSTHQENMIPNGHLGKFVAIEIGDRPWKGRELKIGGAKGMTKEMRKEIWENKDKYLGKVVKYTFQPYGIKELPRLPIWVGFRDERDM
jgi:DNA ligase-1